MNYQIGVFSVIAKVSIKTLRYYQEIGLISPSHIDPDSGYRYYNERLLEKVRIIQKLKDMDFSLREIKDIIENYEDDSELVDYMKTKLAETRQRIKKYQKVQQQIKTIIKLEEEIKMMNSQESIGIKNLEDMLIASIRFKGKYEEVGKYFGKIFKACGFQVKGQPFSLYYDQEYKENDADIEACVPVKREIKKEGINCRALKGGKAHTLIHKGPYECLGESYKKILDYIADNNLKITSPSREVYLKGPGMIFKGNPKKYITEIQMLEIAD